jgi:hypothetical protein
LPVSNAFDGKPDSIWSAGDEAAPQWIEVDFGQPVSITGVRLLTAQDASSTTVHEVPVGTPMGEATSFARLTGPRPTSNGSPTSHRHGLEHPGPPGDHAGPPTPTSAGASATHDHHPDDAATTLVRTRGTQLRGVPG